MKYQKWHIGTASEEDTALLKEAGYPSLLATVLAARGITQPDQARRLLTPPRPLLRHWNGKAL